jgi:hypothetical protein
MKEATTRRQGAALPPTVCPEPSSRDVKIEEVVPAAGPTTGARDGRPEGGQTAGLTSGPGQGECARPDAGSNATSARPVKTSEKETIDGVDAAGMQAPRPGPASTAGQVEAGLRLFVRAGQVVELRALPHDGAVQGGFYDHDHLADMARVAVELSQGGRFKGVYSTLNPVRSALLAHSPNRVSPARKGLAKDADVERRRWLLIDLDPRRPAGVSAADLEKERAEEKARAVRQHLSALGWPEPVLADSGNGFHLLYALDLPASDGGLVKGVLHALAARFDDEHVTIDPRVSNAARITKLYGAKACKGDDAPTGRTAGVGSSRPRRSRGP